MRGKACVSRGNSALFGLDSLKTTQQHCVKATHGSLGSLGAHAAKGEPR